MMWRAGDVWRVAPRRVAHRTHLAPSAHSDVPVRWGLLLSRPLGPASSPIFLNPLPSSLFPFHSSPFTVYLQTDTTLTFLLPHMVSRLRDSLNYFLAYLVRSFVKAA